MSEQCCSPRSPCCTASAEFPSDFPGNLTALLRPVSLTAPDTQGASPGTRETDHGILVARQRLAAEDYHTQFHDEPIRKYVEDVMQEVRRCPPLFARLRSIQNGPKLMWCCGAVRQVRKRSGGSKEL